MTRVQVRWTMKDRFNRQGRSIDISACPTKRGTTRCKCEKCDVCGYGKHSALHGPLFRQPVGSPPYGHEFVARMSEEQIEIQAEVLRGLGR